MRPIFWTFVEWWIRKKVTTRIPVSYLPAREAVIPQFSKRKTKNSPVTVIVGVVCMCMMPVRDFKNHCSCGTFILLRGGVMVMHVYMCQMLKSVEEKQSSVRMSFWMNGRGKISISGVNCLLVSSHPNRAARNVFWYLSSHYSSSVEPEFVSVPKKVIANDTDFRISVYWGHRERMLKRKEI